MNQNRNTPATPIQLTVALLPCILLGLLVGCASQPLEPPAGGPISFARFLEEVRKASSGDFPDAAASGGEFEEMRAHLLELYQDVEVLHSFEIAEEQLADCVPIDRQPALRRPGMEDHRIASPPEFPALPVAPEGLEATTVSTNLPAGLDRHGNERACPEGSFPMRRITLEEMTRFETLGDFFAKVPGGGGHPDLVLAAEASTHYYAHARQTVANRGGTSRLNLWSPTAASGHMSLSQQWTVAGSGSSLQTVEGGWQVYPVKYVTSLAVPFIFWTPDAYATGCYNLDCPGFVQTNAGWVLGAPFSSGSYSVSGGTQMVFDQAWYYDSGNWWLEINGYAIGYYPGSLYGTGPLATGAATVVDFGGEDSGSSTALEMGSGQFADAGYQYAAFQNKIYYYNPSGFADIAVLSAHETNPSCYTIDLTQTSSNPPSFYFGGPSCG